MADFDILSELGSASSMKDEANVFPPVQKSTSCEVNMSSDGPERSAPSEAEVEMLTDLVDGENERCEAQGSVSALRQNAAIVNCNNEGNTSDGSACWEPAQMRIEQNSMKQVDHRSLGDTNSTEELNLALETSNDLSVSNSCTLMQNGSKVSCAKEIASACIQTSSLSARLSKNDTHAGCSSDFQDGGKTKQSHDLQFSRPIEQSSVISRNGEQAASNVPKSIEQSAAILGTVSVDVKETPKDLSEKMWIGNSTDGDRGVTSEKPMENFSDDESEQSLRVNFANSNCVNKNINENLSEDAVVLEGRQTRKEKPSRFQLLVKLYDNTSSKPTLANGRFACDQCSKTFKFTTGLERHKQKCHSKFQCDTCSMVFISKTLLTRHVSSHKEMKSAQQARQAKDAGSGEDGTMDIATIKTRMAEISSAGSKLVRVAKAVSFLVDKSTIISQLTEISRLATDLAESSSNVLVSFKNVCNSDSVLETSEISQADTDNEKVTGRGSGRRSAAAAASKWLAMLNAETYELDMYQKNDYDDVMNGQGSTDLESDISATIKEEPLDSTYAQPASMDMQNEMNLDTQKEVDIPLKPESFRELKDEFGKRWLQCTYCQLVFDNSRGLKRHVMVHEDIRPYRCSKCSQSFRRREHLRKHLVTHSENRPFKCSQCPYKAKTAQRLKIHVMSHSKQNSGRGLEASDIRPVNTHNETGVNEDDTDQNNVGEDDTGDFSDMNDNGSADVDNEETIKDEFQESTYTHLQGISRQIQMNLEGEAGLKNEVDIPLKPESFREFKDEFGKRRLQCTRCQQVFTNTRGLRRHIMVHEDIRPFKCSKCTQSFRRREHLKTHMVTHSEDRPFKCSQCPYKAKTARRLKIHAICHLEEKPFACSLCSYMAKTQSQLNDHVKKHRIRKCTQCDYVCHSLQELKKHISMHASLSCPECDFNTSDHAEYAKHKRKHREFRLLCCELCGYSCNTQSKFNYHMRRHENKTPFHCPDCDYKCSSRQSFDCHRLKHAGLKPFLCTFCGASFVRSTYLKQHLLIHKGEKAHKCSKCDYRCRTKTNLKEHEMTHTGEKPYSCKHCNLAFRRKKAMLIHMAKHEIPPEASMAPAEPSLQVAGPPPYSVNFTSIPPMPSLSRPGRWLQKMQLQPPSMQVPLQMPMIPP